MTYGEERPIESASTIENVTEPGNGGGPSDPTIMPPLKKRKREYLSKSNEKWESSERENVHTSKHQHVSPMNWETGQEHQTKRKGKHSIPTLPKEINSILAI